jgi:CheY-like chemotaxis protein
LSLIQNPKMPKRYIGDARKVKKILMHVISNAIKFTEKGSVAVNSFVGVWEGPVVECIFEVKDTGIGIPPGIVEYLGEKFYQADSSMSREHGGVGIGLSIVKGLLLLLGGSSSIDSEVGRGTTFVLRIPLVLDVYHPDNERFLSEVDLHGVRVLVVEDDLNSGKICQLFLIAKGCEVSLAGDGEECLKAYLQGNHDVILMDCKMPVKDGYETTLEIRKLEEGTGKHIPIIATTAYALTDDENKCRDAGMDEYVSKPIDFDSLTQNIRKLIKRHKK